MNIIKYFLNLIFSRKIYTGANPDNRSEEEIAKDWLHEELAAGDTTTINYVTKDEARKQRKYTIYNQLSSLSCVAHATATEITIMALNKFGKVFKGLALFIYRLRVNYSGGGMIGNNANEIAIKYGIPKFDLYPYMKGESFANAIELTPEMYSDALNQKPVGYFKFARPTWASIAPVVSKGTAVKIFINATVEEWSLETVKILTPGGPFPICHAITILPGTVYKEGNEEYVTVQDSAWFGGFFYRDVPKSFFDAGRLSYSSYFTDLVYKLGQGEKPYFHFEKHLKFGDRGTDVKALQDILIYEGLMPVGYNTGYFGGLSLKGVKLYQEKYREEILKPTGLTSPTGYVGDYTIKKLNQ